MNEIIILEVIFFDHHWEIICWNNWHLEIFWISALAKIVLENQRPAQREKYFKIYIN